MKTNSKDANYAMSRRSLIRMGVTAGAVLGLPRWKVFEVLQATAGSAVADEAACAAVNRSVHIVGGNGGFAWFQLLWPHNQVAAAANPNFAWPFEPTGQGSTRIVGGTDGGPLTLGPASPWQNLPPERQVTGMMAGGIPVEHTDQPTSNTFVSSNISLFAACAAAQTQIPVTLPVVGIQNFRNLLYGDAPGAPPIARVNTAQDAANLFSSAASRTLLNDQAKAGQFYSTYNTMLQLRAAAHLPTSRLGTSQGQIAASLLGKNFAQQLQVTDEDRARYGSRPVVCRDISGTIDDGIFRVRTSECDPLVDSLIVTAKMLRLGLTNCVIIQALYNDPHEGFFADMVPIVRTNAGAIGAALNAFDADLDVEDPICAGTKLRDNLIMSIHGDTPKSPLSVQGDWLDATPNGTNWIYVRGAGYLKTGWLGEVRADGSTTTFNPATGEHVGGGSGGTGEAAAAAVLYAVCKGDLRRLSDFYKGDLSGIIKHARS